MQTSHPLNAFNHYLSNIRIQEENTNSFYKKLLTTIVCTTLTSVSFAVVNSEDDFSNYPVATLPSITFTATRSPFAINNTIAQIDVIDSEELKHFEGQTVLDVLKRQPGFSFKQNGSQGTLANFYLRGYDSTQVLVLIDGIRFSSISSGQPSLHLLPVDQIERIEVLYGASGTSIYGADAMGGVIQIFTKGSNVEQNQFSITGGVGSHDHYLYGATAQLTNGEGTSLSLSASRNETDGIDATAFNHSWGIHNKDDDGFESDNYSLFLNHKINDNLRIGLSGLYNKSTSEFDSGYTEGADTTASEQKTGAANGFIDWEYQPNSSLKLTYGQSIDESDTTATTYSSEYDTQQQQISLVGNHSFTNDKLIYGVEHLIQEIDTTAYADIDDRDVTSAFLGYLLTRDKFDAQANVRHDDYSEYDSKTTYNLGAAYNITPELRVGLNYAKGYRVPTFNDLFGYGGDINLNPEDSDNYEAFVEFDTYDYSLRLTGYRNNVEDLITSDQNYQRINFAKAKIEGLTVNADWNIDDYLAGFSYDYQEAKDDSGDRNDGNFLPYRPKHKGSIYLGYQLNDLDLRAEYQYVDDYFSGKDNLDSQHVESYDIVNISGNYQLSPNLSIATRINNVFNEKYITEPGYNTDGTNYMTSLTYHWK